MLRIVAGRSRRHENSCWTRLLALCDEPYRVRHVRFEDAAEQPQPPSLPVPHDWQLPARLKLAAARLGLAPCSGNWTLVRRVATYRTAVEQQQVQIQDPDVIVEALGSVPTDVGLGLPPFWEGCNVPSGCIPYCLTHNVAVVHSDWVADVASTKSLVDVVRLQVPLGVVRQVIADGAVTISAGDAIHAYRYGICALPSICAHFCLLQRCALANVQAQECTATMHTRAGMQHAQIANAHPSKTKSILQN